MDKLSVYCRSSTGLQNINLESVNSNVKSSESDIQNSECRCLAFSSCGQWLAYCTSSGVDVVSLSSNQKITLNHPKAVHILFSPCANVIAIWEQFVTTSDNPQGSPNLNLYCSKSGTFLKGFVQRKLDNWKPQWSADEFLCARIVTGEAHIYNKNDFGRMHCKLALANLCTASLTFTQNNYHLAVHVPGKKGQPSFVRIFKYPHLDASNVIANKSFYKAEKVELLWNSSGTALLILTAMEVSDGSYYGEQGLHFVSVNGDSSIVPQSKNGPIYHIEWHPNSTEFIVTCGYMPAKTTVYNMKCEPVFDFGTGPRNVTYFNSFGNILCLAGFGNLKGDIEIWDYSKKRIISKFVASDTTQFAWSSSGDYILTATTHPRLRVNNGFRIWHYSGRVVYERTIKMLFDSCFLPIDSKKLSPPVLVYNENLNYKSMVEKSQATKYVPPQLRNRSGPPSNTGQLRDDYELPSNQRQTESASLSKSALKNQKRKEAKQKSAAVPVSANSKTMTTTSNVAPSYVNDGDEQTMKKVRALQKKLAQIDKLKESVAAGRQLELNQTEKLRSEDTLRAELHALTLS